MAKIVQTLTRASDEYEVDVAQSLIRDLDAVIEKLNTQPNTPNTVSYTHLRAHETDS